MPEPRISIVIATYNRLSPLRRTLEALRVQTLPPESYEVIVVDDGSPDDTMERLATLARSGAIRVVRQPNRGVAAARNRGIAEAEGEAVCLLDDDDLLEEGSLARLAAALDASPDAVAAHGGFGLLTGEELLAGEDQRPPTGDVLAALELGNRFVSPGQLLLRASALAAVGGLDEQIRGSDDWDLWLRLARRGPFVRVDEPTLRYRVHGANASRHALRLTRAHLRVALRHLGARPASLRAHLARAEPFFVPLLLAEASSLRADGRPRRAALSALAALLFRPNLALWPGLVVFVASGLCGLGRIPPRSLTS